jgi:DNA-binding winged helix-turn-helix (wHTH) protein
MVQATTLIFADLRIDLANECAWQGSQALHLTPTAFALLRQLVEHAGQLVTKEALLQALWPETAVTEGMLTTHVRQVRHALGDDPRAPRYIETVHRRGYRFLPALTTRPVPGSKFQVSSSDTQHSGLGARHSVLVGREAELAQLHTWFGKAVRCR